MINVLENLLPVSYTIQSIYDPDTLNTIMYVLFNVKNRSYTISLNKLRFNRRDTWDIRQNIDGNYTWSNEKNEYTFEVDECDYAHYDIHIRGEFWLYTDEYLIWIARQILKVLNKND
jgi:hypothetical protein